MQRRAADVSAAELALRAERQEDRLIERTSAEQAQQALERWQRRLKELDESERQLKAQLADIAAERQRVDKDRRELHEVRAQQARQLKSECETVKAAWNTRMVKLQERSEQLERRQIAVRQLHAEVLRMYREATELRICTEELWGEISQQVSPATLTQKLGTLRRRLAEQFQLAADNLERQKKEMQTLITRLADHRATIQQQRDEVQTWLRRRQDEIEQQAARLVAREQELDRQQAEIKHLRTHWEHQRHAYEQEIRRLKQKQAVVT